MQTQPMLLSNTIKPLKPFNMSARISKTKRRVVLHDLDQVYRDVVIEGEGASKFIRNLSNAAKSMPDVTMADALNIVAASAVAGHWV